MTPSVTIYTVNNGYVLESPGYNCVVEEPEREGGEVIAAANLLYTLLDILGVYGTKHDKLRVHVRVVNQETGEDVVHE